MDEWLLLSSFPPLPPLAALHLLFLYFFSDGLLYFFDVCMYVCVCFFGLVWFGLVCFRPGGGQALKQRSAARRPPATDALIDPSPIPSFHSLKSVSQSVIHPQA